MLGNFTYVKTRNSRFKTVKKQKPLLKKKKKKNPQKTHVEPYSSAIMVPNGIHPIHVVTLQPCFKVRVICFLWIIECST